MKLTIGNVTLDNQVILAPMAGVSDLPFRLLCHEQGAGLVCMEMVSAKALQYIIIKIQKVCYRFIPGNIRFLSSSLAQNRKPLRSRQHDWKTVLLTFWI